MSLATEEKVPPKLTTAANLVLGGAATACLLVVLYCSYRYGWTGRAQLTSWMGILLYCILPAALAIVLFAVLRLRASRKVNLALLLCSTGVSIYAVESLLTVWHSLPSVSVEEARQARAHAAKAVGIHFDTRSPRQVVRDLVSQGADAIPSVFPQAFLDEQQDGTVRSPLRINRSELLPLAGISNKLVVLCNETGTFLTYRSDEHGFNNPLALWAKVPADVVAVGDSYTHGHCVDENFVTVIRQRYPATLNLGMEGNGPLTMLGTIKEYARIVKPRMVLWFHFEGNDPKDLQRESKSPLLRRYLTNGFRQDLAARQPEIDRALTDYLETIEDKSALAIKLGELSALFSDASGLGTRLKRVVKLGLIRQRLGLVYGKKGVQETDRLQPDLFYDILVEAKRSADEWGGRLYFVYLPGWGRYESPGGYRPRERREVLSAASRAGLPVVDIHQSFLRRKDPLALFPFRLRGHYTEEGHRLVAKEVLEAISGAPRR